MNPAQKAAFEEARKLLGHLIKFMEQHNLLVPELVVTAVGIEARLSLKRLPPPAPRAA